MNLFVVHTQYNLILSLGLSSQEDEIILFKDFNFTPELEKKLRGHFSRCLFLDGAYPKREMTAREKLRKISADNKQIKGFMKAGYEKVFIVEDMCIQEMYCMKLAATTNKNVQLCWLEDGANAYFDNKAISSGMGSTVEKRFVRKVFFSLRFNLGSFYDLGPCMGSHKMLQIVYVCFPSQIRKELSKKHIIEIFQQEFETGLRAIFGGDKIKFEDNSILIALDKLSVYGNKLDQVEEIVSGIINRANKSRQRVYYKYHPRETESLNALSTAIELDRKTALESYLINSSTSKLEVVGIKSTSLQTAKKLGFRAVSYIKSIEDNPDVLNYYTEIGVECR